MGAIKGVNQAGILGAVQELLAEGRFSGVCRCGCGGKTEIATQTRRNRGGEIHQVAGYPQDWIKGHASSIVQIKTGTTMTGFGYRLVRAPSHPNAHRGYVREHILIMEAHLGRYLRKHNPNGPNIRTDEVVHHINFDKADNRLENLQLMTHRDHMLLHANLSGRGNNGVRRSATFTDELAAEIRSKYPDTKVKELVKLYKLSESTIYRILNGGGSR